jgi:hypothetical protein
MPGKLMAKPSVPDDAASARFVQKGIRFVGFVAAQA